MLGQALAGWGVWGWDPLASFHLLWAGALGSLGWDRLPAPQPHPGQPQRQPLEGFLCVTSLGTHLSYLVLDSPSQRQSSQALETLFQDRGSPSVSLHVV